VLHLWLDGAGSSRLPWQQYHCHPATFGEYDLPAIWDEFSAGQIGVILTIWDLTRVQWLARPDLFDSPAREWALRMRSKIRLWGYVPVDSTGPGNKLTAMSRETLLGFDRLLAYSPFGEEVIRNSIGAEEAAVRGLEWLPHGLNCEVFKQIPAKADGVTHEVGDGQDNLETVPAKGEVGGASEVSPVSVAGNGSDKIVKIGVVARIRHGRIGDWSQPSHTAERCT